MIQDWKKKRVTVMGLGRFGGGVGVTRWLAAAGAEVLVTDLAPPEKLTVSLEQIADCGVTLRLGEHNEQDFRQADLIVPSPAVPDNSPLLEIARAAGVPITTEMNLFVERCLARCVGVTGSVGKSTITAMIGHMLREAEIEGLRDRGISGRVWVGGNIGKSLLEDLGRITADDLVVLELSSFQLQHTPAVRWSPHVAVVTNVTPNHLDRHGTFEAYLDAKLNIVRFQARARDAVILEGTAELRQNFAKMLGWEDGVWCYGLAGDVPTATRQPVSSSTRDEDLQRWPKLQLDVPGRHNRENAAAALTVAHVLGISPDAAVKALGTFEALPHRLQRVGVRDGVSFYNDSKSTTPESAITAMNSIDGPLLVILGGYDKGSDLQSVVGVAAKRAKFAACIGQTGSAVFEAIRTAGGTAGYCGDLASAVAACRQRAQPGDAVLLSPACASWDQFVDYRARGELFAQLALQGSATHNQEVKPWQAK